MIKKESTMRYNHNRNLNKIRSEMKIKKENYKIQYFIEQNNNKKNQNKMTKK